MEMPRRAAASLRGRSKSCLTLLWLSTTGSLDARAACPARRRVKISDMPAPVPDPAPSSELSPPPPSISSELPPSEEWGRVEAAEVGETDPDPEAGCEPEAVRVGACCVALEEALRDGGPVEEEHDDEEEAESFALLTPPPPATRDMRSASWRSAVFSSDVRRHVCLAAAAAPACAAAVGGPQRSICRIWACVSRESVWAEVGGGEGDVVHPMAAAKVPTGARRGEVPDASIDGGTLGGWPRPCGIVLKDDIGPCGGRWTRWDAALVRRW
mmetsp:Transcript_24381/g.47312  ORF Transcript_24381/g.47312 Transcript_24381/m.47312 type:complete len:270 (-) Transcript_24381:224-1033(-)